LYKFQTRYLHMKLYIQFEPLKEADLVRLCNSAIIKLSH